MRGQSRKTRQGAVKRNVGKRRRWPEVVAVGVGRGGPIQRVLGYKRVSFQERDCLWPWLSVTLGCMSADPTDPASLLTSHRVWPFSFVTNQDLSVPLLPGPVPSQLCPWGFPLPCETWRARQVTRDPAPRRPLLGGRDNLAKLLFSDSPSSRLPAAP